MKARYAYPLLYLPLSAMCAALVAIVFAVCAAGIMWLFIYGDNPWSAAADHAVMALSALVFAGVLAAALVVLHRFGKQQESLDGLSRKHVVIALVATLLLPLLILARQWSIGAIGDGPYSRSRLDLHPPGS